MRISSHFLLQVPQAHSLARSSRVQSHAPRLSEKNLRKTEVATKVAEQVQNAANAPYSHTKKLLYKKNSQILKTNEFHKSLRYLLIYNTLMVLPERLPNCLQNPVLIIFLQMFSMTFRGNPLYLPIRRSMWKVLDDKIHNLESWGIQILIAFGWDWLMILLLLHHED